MQQRDTAIHPAIWELIRLLPPAGTPWSVAERARFLAALSATLNAVYPPAGSEEDGR
jgi:hypothetical protein